MKTSPNTMTRHLVFLLLILSLPVRGWAGNPSTAKVLTLEEAVAIALRHNPSIGEAEAGKEGAQAEVQGAAADMLPRLSTQYSYSRLAEQPYQRIGEIERFSSDKDMHHWDVTLTQPLFTGYALTSKQKMAEIEVEIKTLESDRAAIQVSQNLRIAWFETLHSQKLAQVAAESLAALSAHRDNAQGFFDQGLISRNDLLKAETALAQARQEKERAGAALETARERLATILGTELAPDCSLEDFTSIGPQPDSLADLTGEAIQQNPLLNSYRLGLSQLDSSITLAKSTAYPSVALVGKYEQNGNDPGATINTYTNDHNAALSVVAKWDIYDWGRTNANVTKQQSAKRILAEKTRAIEDQLRLEVKRAWLDLQVAKTNISTAEQGLEQAKENWRITDLQYQNQVATSTDVLDSRALLSQAEGNFYQALYGYRIAMAQLNRAVGRK